MLCEQSASLDYARCVQALTSYCLYPFLQELLAWVNEIAELSREQLGAGGGTSTGPEPGRAPPDQLVAAGWEALVGDSSEDGSAPPPPRSQDVAPLFGQVLQDGSGATAAQKAAAWAGMAVCALLEGNVGGAKDLVASAQKAAPQDAVSPFMLWKYCCCQ